MKKNKNNNKGYTELYFTLACVLQFIWAFISQWFQSTNKQKMHAVSISSKLMAGLFFHTTHLDWLHMILVLWQSSIWVFCAINITVKWACFGIGQAFTAVSSHVVGTSFDLAVMYSETLVCAVCLLCSTCIFTMSAYLILPLVSSVLTCLDSFASDHSALWSVLHWRKAKLVYCDSSFLTTAVTMQFLLPAKHSRL